MLLASFDVVHQAHLSGHNILVQEAWIFQCEIIIEECKKLSKEIIFCPKKIQQNRRFPLAHIKNWSFKFLSFLVWKVPNIISFLLSFDNRTGENGQNFKFVFGQVIIFCKLFIKKSPGSQRFWTVWGIELQLPSPMRFFLTLR